MTEEQDKMEEILQTENLEKVMPENMMSDEEIKEMMNWLMGVTVEPPEAVKRIVSNLTTKLNAMMGYLMTVKLSETQRLMEFDSKARERLYHVGRVDEMDPDELQEAHDRVFNMIQNNMEFIRKFVYQNKEIMENTKVDRLSALLLSLPDSKLEMLREKLEKGEL